MKLIQSLKQKLLNLVRQIDLERMRSVLNKVHHEHSKLVLRHLLLQRKVENLEKRLLQLEMELKKKNDNQ